MIATLAAPTVIKEPEKPAEATDEGKEGEETAPEADAKSSEGDKKDSDKKENEEKKSPQEKK